MTFARFSNSGISLFDHVDHGPVCWNCSQLAGQEQPYFATRDLDAMLAHVGEHRAAGEAIDESVEETLREEWESGA